MLYIRDAALNDFSDNIDSISILRSARGKFPRIPDWLGILNQNWRWYIDTSFGFDFILLIGGISVCVTDAAISKGLASKNRA